MAHKPVAEGKSSFDLIDMTRFFTLLDPGPGAMVADLACGTGRYSLEMARRLGGSGKVHAVDLRPEGIAILHQAIREQHITNLEAHVADITRGVPLAGGTLDACLLAAVLHELSIEEQNGALREAARLLKPGGTLAVIEFKKKEGGPGPPVRIRLAEHELEQRIAPHGFALRRCDELGLYMYLCQFGKT
jgi:ubiquinone/menaquinone biosynthesis C-methylase UbiE